MMYSTYFLTITLHIDGKNVAKKFFYVMEQIGTIAFAHTAWKLKTTNKNKDRREFFHCNHVMEQYPEPLSTEIDTIDKNQFKFFSTKNGDPKLIKATVQIWET